MSDQLDETVPNIHPKDNPAPCINCNVRLLNYSITCQECGAQNPNYKVWALRKENEELRGALTYIAAVASDYGEGQRMSADDVQLILTTARKALATQSTGTMDDQ